MRKLIACLCAAIGICMGLSAAEPLTPFFSPYADAYLYLTNKYTRKNIDSALWNKMQKESEDAARQFESEEFDAGDSDEEEEEEEDDPIAILADMISERDASAVFNLYGISWKDMKLVISGVANVSGNLVSDLESVRKKCPSFKKKDSNGNTVYSYDNPEGVKFSIVATNQNTLHFRIDARYNNPVPFVPSKPFREQVSLPFEIKEQMFVFKCRPEHIDRLIPSSMKKSGKFSNDIRKVSDFIISGQFESKIMKLNAIADCTDEESANALLTSLDESFREDVLSGTFGRVFSNYRHSVSGKKILFDFDFELDKAWEVFKTMPGLIMDNDLVPRP